MRRALELGILASLAIGLFGCGDGEKKGVGELCGADADCEDSICHHGACYSASPQADGTPCAVDAQCKSLNCVNQVCAPGTYGAGEACRSDEECASGTCEGKSTPPGTCAGGATPDAGVDGLQDAVLDLPPSDGPSDGPELEAAGDLPWSEAAPDLALPDAIWPDLCNCGNNTIEVSCGEVCDSASLDGKQCVDLGYPSNGGILVCAKDCKSFVTTDCYSKPDAADIAIATTTAESESNPDVASDGTDWLVVYYNSTQKKILGRRVTANGALPDPTPIVIGTGGVEPQVTYNGSKYLVVWESSGLKGALVDPATGAVTAVPSIQNGFTLHDLRVASVGSSTLITWETSNNVMGLRVDPTGCAVGSGVFGIAAAPNPSSERYPALAAGDKDWFVVWQLYDATKSPQFSLHGKKVDLNGTVGPSIPIATAGGSPNDPTVAFDGKHYFVAWALETYKARQVLWTRVNPDVQKVLHAPVVLLPKKTTTNTDYIPFAARHADADQILVATRESSNIQAHRLEVNAGVNPAPKTSIPIAITSVSEWAQRAAAAKTHSLVVWQKGGTSSAMDIYATRYR